MNANNVTPVLNCVKSILGHQKLGFLRREDRHLKIVGIYQWGCDARPLSYCLPDTASGNFVGTAVVQQRCRLHITLISALCL